MRQLSFILAIIIGLMTLTQAPAMSPHAEGSTVTIQAFDFCHSSPTGHQVELPDFIQELSGCPGPPPIVGVRTPPDTLFTPLLISYHDERPPRA